MCFSSASYTTCSKQKSTLRTSSGHSFSALNIVLTGLLRQVQTHFPAFLKRNWQTEWKTTVGDILVEIRIEIDQSKDCCVSREVLLMSWKSNGALKMHKMAGPLKIERRDKFGKFMIFFSSLLICSIEIGFFVYTHYRLLKSEVNIDLVCLQGSVHIL